MVTVNLQDDVAAALTATASGLGLSLEAYLASLAVPRTNGNPSALTAEELDALLEAEASDDSTYQGTYSRADIYQDHA